MRLLRDFTLNWMLRSCRNLRLNKDWLHWCKDFYTKAPGILSKDDARLTYTQIDRRWSSNCWNLLRCQCLLLLPLLFCLVDLPRSASASLHRRSDACIRHCFFFRPHGCTSGDQERTKRRVFSSNQSPNTTMGYVQSDMNSRQTAAKTRHSMSAACQIQERQHKKRCVHISHEEAKGHKSLCESIKWQCSMSISRRDTTDTKASISHAHQPTAPPKQKTSRCCTQMPFCITICA